MELPTYTNIWKIEKRLYKLYDFRLPMPLPIGQVAAFLAIAIPYMLALTLAGMPFSHTWVWLYVLPPGVAAWLVTRPVLEGKRLPELVVSQVRYLTEPRTWCRLEPLAEADHVEVVARVWRATARPARNTTADPDEMPTVQARPAATPRPVWPDRPAVRPQVPEPAVSAPGRLRPPAQAVATIVTGEPAVGVAMPADQERAPAAGSSSAPTAIATDLEQISNAAAVPSGGDDAAIAAADEAGAAGAVEDAAAGPDEIAAAPCGAHDSAPIAQAAGAGSTTTVRPVLWVRDDTGGTRPLHVVERALRTSRAGWRDRVVVVPGGHRPGSPDYAQRDQARARLPLAGPARIVVLGTTAGAGQTVTTLLTAQLLAILRGEAVAVVDFGGRPGSLTELARQLPRWLPRHASGQAAGGWAKPGLERGLQVVTADHSGPGPRDADRLIDAVVARYPITLADPAPPDVPRAVQVADQLVLVTPVGAGSADSLAMTLEWLEAHGHGRLAKTSITVLNGVSAPTTEDTDRATTVASGRCRAIVRVPWDNSLGASGQLGAATVQAYTALAGVLVTGLADPVLAGSAGAGSASQ